MKFTNTQIAIGIVILAAFLLIIFKPWKTKSITSDTGSGDTGSGARTFGGGYNDPKNGIITYLRNRVPNANPNELTSVINEVNGLSNEKAEVIYKSIQFNNVAKQQKMCGGHTGVVAVWHCIKNFGEWVWGH